MDPWIEKTKMRTFPPPAPRPPPQHPSSPGSSKPATLSHPAESETIISEDKKINNNKLNKYENRSKI